MKHPGEFFVLESNLAPTIRWHKRLSLRATSQAILCRSKSSARTPAPDLSADKRPPNSRPRVFWFKWVELCGGPGPGGTSGRVRSGRMWTSWLLDAGECGWIWPSAGGSSCHSPLIADWTGELFRTRALCQEAKSSTTVSHAGGSKFYRQLVPAVSWVVVQRKERLQWTTLPYFYSCDTFKRITFRNTGELIDLVMHQATTRYICIHLFVERLVRVIRATLTNRSASILFVESDTRRMSSKTLAWN